MFPDIQRGTAFGATRAADWQDLMTVVKDNAIAVAPARPTLPAVGSRGFAETGVGGADFGAFVFASGIEDDHFVGFPLDEHGEVVLPAQQVKIAKPLGLRKSTYWDAETDSPIRINRMAFRSWLEYSFPDSSIERVATDQDGNMERQIITPLYVFQETIIAMRAPPFLTGAADIEWLETALAVRREWAAKDNQSGD